MVGGEGGWGRRKINSWGMQMQETQVVPQWYARVTCRRVTWRLGDIGGGARVMASHGCSLAGRTARLVAMAITMVALDHDDDAHGSCFGITIE